MKIECLVKPNKNNDGYYLFIPMLEKYVFLEKIEIKYLQMMLDLNQEKVKSDNK